MSKSKGRVAKGYYSPREASVLAILTKSKGRRMSTTDLIEKVFTKSVPFHARQSILSTLSSLASKVEKKGEKFEIKRSNRRGPRPVSFWLEDRS